MLVRCLLVTGVCGVYEFVLRLGLIVDYCLLFDFLSGFWGVTLGLFTLCLLIFSLLFIVFVS